MHTNVRFNGGDRCLQKSSLDIPRSMALPKCEQLRAHRLRCAPVSRPQCEPQLRWRNPYGCTLKLVRSIGVQLESTRRRGAGWLHRVLYIGRWSSVVEKSVVDDVQLGFNLEFSRDTACFLSTLDGESARLSFRHSVGLTCSSPLYRISMKRDEMLEHR